MGRIGGGGGGRRPGRNCNPDQRQKLQKKTNPGLPSEDLKKIGDRMLNRAKNFTPSFSHEKKGPVQYADPYQGRGQPGEPGYLGDLPGGDAEGNDGAEDHDDHDGGESNNDSTAGGVGKANISEYAALAIKAKQAQAQHQAPLDLLASGNSNGQVAGGGTQSTAFGLGVTAANSNIDVSDAFAGKEHNTHQEQSARKFYTDLKKVIEISDVLLEVLDCRDPMGCRLSNIEKMIESQYGDKKTVVVVLNKTDLVPEEVVEQWVQFFNRERKITVKFNASSEGSNANHRRTRSIRSNQCVSELYRVLRSVGRGEGGGEVGAHGGARKALTVGVIGYPNVGKSSLINALRRKDVVGVGNTPGFTTGNQEVDLRKDIRIHDCPGVVSGTGHGDNGDVVLRNAVKLDQLDNPLLAIARLYERCDRGMLNQFYQVQVGGPKKKPANPFASPEDRDEAGGFGGAGSLAAGSAPAARGTKEFNDEVEDFLRQVGVRRGRVRQGGRIDENETAKMILQDWNDGRIGYFTLPPEQDGLLSNFGVRSTSDLAHQHEEDDNDRQILSSFTRALTADGMPTFQLASKLNGVTLGIGTKKAKAGHAVGFRDPRQQRGKRNRGRQDDDEVPRADANWSDEDEVM